MREEEERENDSRFVKITVDKPITIALRSSYCPARLGARTCSVYIYIYIYEYTSVDR